MKQDNKKEKKSKKSHKPNRKMSWLDKVKLWLLQHSKIAFLLDSSIFFFISFWGILFVVWNNSYSKTLSKLQLCLSALSESYILSEHALSRCF